jgi:protein O-mannosyl-transferase
LLTSAKEGSSFFRSFAFNPTVKLNPFKIDMNDREETATGITQSSLRRYLQKDWLRCLLLALIGVAVRAPALQGQLIWDDQYLARDNPFIKSPLLALEAFRHHLFLDSFSAHYRPVQNLSFMWDYAFWNSNTFGFHVTNVLLHVFSGLLLYFLLRRLLDSLGLVLRKIDNSIVALFIAAAWIVHPVHSAAVDYISGRADSLAFVLASGAWLLFFKSREGSIRWRKTLLCSGAALCALLALCSRETALVWVALFLLHLFVFDQHTMRRAKLAIVLACVAIVVAYAGLRHLPEQRSTRGPSMDWSPPVRAVLMLRALGDYGRLMVFPANLHMERTVINSVAFQNEKGREVVLDLEYLSVIGLAIAALLGGLSFYRSPAQRLRAFGALWFVVGFIPISNIVDLNATVAEHWLYLPSVGFFIFLAGCAIDLPHRLRRGFAFVAIFALIALSARSFYRSSDWINAETFYERTAAAGGTSGRVSVNLGQIYAGHGEYAKAEKIFRDILKIQPDYTIARNNLADALAHLGREQEAEQVLAEATRGAHESRKDYPRTWIAAMNLARMLVARGDETAALATLKQAQTDYPPTWELISYETELFRRANKLDDAIARVEPFAQNHWWHYGAWMALGRLRAEKGEVALAERALRHANWLDVHSTDGLNLMALMRLHQNRFEDACQLQRRAVARQPDQPSQYMLLSNILDKMGRSDEARAALARVTELKNLASAQKVAD